MSDNIYKEFMGATVSLKDYDANFPVGHPIRDTLFPKGKWKEWKFLFIGDWKVDDPRLSNLGVRADQNKGSASDDIAYDFEINAWKSNFFPPVVGTDGNVRDGRTRIIAAIKKKQQWIPVAEYYFEETDTPIRDKVTAGVLGNSTHSPLTRLTMEDFVIAGIAMIDSGEIERDKDKLMKWLIDDAKVGLRFSNEGGTFSKIVNDIVKLTADTDNLTRVLDRDQWLEWLKQANGASSDWFLHKSSKKQTDALLVWRDHILPQVENTNKKDIEKEGKWKTEKPYKIVIYTDKLTAGDSSNYIESFKQELDDLYTKSYSLIDSAIGGMLNKTCPSVKPYEIVGVCPNLHRGGQDELYDNFQLVDVDDYINQGSAISIALKIAA